VKSNIEATISEHFNCEPEKCKQTQGERLFRVVSIIKILKGAQ